ncbi:MAG: hypothetical protein JWN46_359 [Acidimicrobiales bacterium]|nr:hypothetical protein [Acidimicrobiales bacterium]
MKLKQRALATIGAVTFAALAIGAVAPAAHAAPPVKGDGTASYYYQNCEYIKGPDGKRILLYCYA